MLSQLRGTAPKDDGNSEHLTSPLGNLELRPPPLAGADGLGAAEEVGLGLGREVVVGAAEVVVGGGGGAEEEEVDDDDDEEDDDDLDSMN